MRVECVQLDDYGINQSVIFFDVLFHPSGYIVAFACYRHHSCSCWSNKTTFQLELPIPRRKRPLSYLQLVLERRWSLSSTDICKDFRWRWRDLRVPRCNASAIAFQIRRLGWRTIICYLIMAHVWGNDKQDDCRLVSLIFWRWSEWALQSGLIWSEKPGRNLFRRYLHVQGFNVSYNITRWKLNWIFIGEEIFLFWNFA